MHSVEVTGGETRCVSACRWIKQWVGIRGAPLVGMLLLRSGWCFQVSMCIECVSVSVRHPSHACCHAPTRFHSPLFEFVPVVRPNRVDTPLKACQVCYVRLWAYGGCELRGCRAI